MLLPRYLVRFDAGSTFCLTGRVLQNQKYGSIVVLSSVANTHGGECLESRRWLSSADKHRQGCWGPALTMSSHAALGLVKSGVAVLKGQSHSSASQLGC